MLTCVTFFLQQSKLWYKYFFELPPPMISHVWMGGRGGGRELKWKYKKCFNLVGLFSFSPPPLFFSALVPMDLRIFFATKWKLILLFSTLVSNLACSYISATSLIVSSPPRIILFGGPCKDLRCSLTDCFFLRLYLKSIVHKRSSVVEKDVEKNYIAFESQSCLYNLKARSDKVLIRNITRKLVHFADLVLSSYPWLSFCIYSFWCIDLLRIKWLIRKMHA